MKATLVVSAALLILAGCSSPVQNAADAIVNDSALADQAEEQLAPPKTPDQAFVDTVAAMNAYGAAAGTLAEQKGSSAAVKAFGKKLAQDHIQSMMKLKLAAAKTPGLLVDATLSDEQNANVKTLQNASGGAFDAAFKGQVVAGLTRLQTLLEQRYQPMGGDGDLKSFASYQGPVVRADLARAKAL